jgi:hypothetical protein
MRRRTSPTPLPPLWHGCLRSSRIEVPSFTDIARANEFIQKRHRSVATGYDLLPTRRHRAPPRQLPPHCHVLPIPHPVPPTLSLDGPPAILQNQ